MPAPKLERIPRSRLPDDVAAAHDHSMQLRGDATFFEVFGQHPELYRWYTQRFYGDVFDGLRVERRWKEILRYRLSTTHGCRFCNQGNRADALAAGLGEHELDAIERNDVASLSAQTRAVLALADEMVLTNPHGRLSDGLHERLSAHFTDAEILELGLIAGILTGVAKFLFVFDLVEREDSCPYPG